MPTPPFRLFPWQFDFLAAVLDGRPLTYSHRRRPADMNPTGGMMHHRHTDPRVLDAPRPEQVVVYAQTGPNRAARRAAQGRRRAVNQPFAGDVAADLVTPTFARREASRAEAARRLAALLNVDAPGEG